jgi:hypothetical protein
MDFDRAEIIAINCLSFIASDEKHLTIYLNLCGLDLNTLRVNVTHPGKMNETFAGVLDFLMGNENLLLEFAESYSLDPLDIGRARRFFPGAPLE